MNLFKFWASFRLFFLATVGGVVALSAADSTSLLGGMSGRIDRAIQAGDDSALSVELAKCDSILAEDPQVGAALYYKGWLLMHRATTLVGESKDRRKGLFDAAEKALSSAHRLTQWPEALSLHASVLERSISVKGGLSAMRLGPKAAGEHDEAAQVAPQNPRVALLRGISLLHRPAFVGGGAKEALAEFTRAAELFATEAAAPTGSAELPRWGQVEVWAWLGQAHAKLGDKASARTAYAKALELNPDYGWVSHVLLPAVGE